MKSAIFRFRNLPYSIIILLLTLKANSTFLGPRESRRRDRVSSDGRPSMSSPRDRGSVDRPDSGHRRTASDPGADRRGVAFASDPELFCGEGVEFPGRTSDR